MKILKFLNNSENSSSAYFALISSPFLIKKGHNVYVMGRKNTYAWDYSKKNRIEFIENKFYSFTRLIKIPECDVIEISDYSSLNRLTINRLLNMGRINILRLNEFPDEKTIEFIKNNIKRINLIITPYPSIKDDLVFSNIDSEKIRVINPILLMTRWESAKQIKPMTFLTRPYRILTVYRNFNFESLKFFLVVAREVLKSNHNINFSIAGVKDERIRKLAREFEISHKVDILGWRNDMPEVMAMTHIYLKTDLEANGSRSLIEAMASSVVSVVGDVKGLSDFIISGYNGVVVKRGDVNSYVREILSLINDPLKMQTISAIGYNWARANFDLNVVAKVEEVIYEDLILRKVNVGKGYKLG